MATRTYSDGCWKDIGCEVILTGKSRGWIVPHESDPSYKRVAKVVMDTEHELAKFNIGYTDDMNGAWTRVSEGTRFFQGML